MPHAFGKPYRSKEKPDPTAPHQDWMVDLTYIPIQAVDWYLIVPEAIAGCIQSLHSGLGTIIQYDLA